MRNLCQWGAAVLMSAAILAGSMVTGSADGGKVTVILNNEVLTKEAYVDANFRTQVPSTVGEELGIAAKLKAGDLAGDTTVVEGYLPLRYIAEAAGYEVEWSDEVQAVVLKSPAAKPLVISAGKAVLSGQGYGADGEKADTRYDSDLESVVLLGENAQIRYTAPADGRYDVYLYLGKSGTPRGSTVVGFSVNDAPVYAVPPLLMPLRGTAQTAIPRGCFSWRRMSA